MRRGEADAQNLMLHGEEVLHGREGVLGRALLLTVADQGGKGGVHALDWVLWVGDQQQSLGEGESPGLGEDNLERASWLVW